MKSVWKLVCLLGLIALVAVTVFAYTLSSQIPPPVVLRPLLAVCVVLAAGGAARSGISAFTKRHTAATGF
jgi:hypothetical protein